MQAHYDKVFSAEGGIVGGSTITVRDSNGALAILYADNGVSRKSNPFLAGDDGEYNFYAFNGTYSIEIAKDGYVTETQTGVVLFDPLDLNGFSGSLAFARETFAPGAGDTEVVLQTINVTPGVGTVSVYIDGLYQTPGVDFAEGLDGKTLTFVSKFAGTEQVAVFVGKTVTSGFSSEQVSFIQNGAGAVPRSITAKMQEIVSVTDFGATGDGVTDDTAACQAAIDHVATLGGGTVYFPAGKYWISATLTAWSSPVHLVGAGVSATELLAVHITGPVISIKYYYSGVRAMSLIGWGARFGAINTSGVGVYFQLDSEIARDGIGQYVEDAIIQWQPSHAIHCESQGFRAENIRIIKCGGHGIYGDSPDPVHPFGFSELKNLQITDTGGHAICAGVNAATFRLVLDNVDAWNNAYNPTVRRGLHAIWLRGENIAVRHCGIAGYWNDQSQSNVDCLYINGRSPHVENNRFLQPRLHCVVLGPNSHGARVIDNHIVGTLYAVTLDTAVLIESGCVGALVKWGFPAWVTSPATLSTPNSGTLSEIYNIPLQGYRSAIARAQVADDTVKTYTLRGDAGAAWGVVLLGFNSSFSEACLIAWRAGDASAYCALLSSATHVNTTTGVLVGTTGTDGKLTISVSTTGTPILYIENRRGAPIDMMPTFLSIGRGEVAGVT